MKPLTCGKSASQVTSTSSPVIIFSTNVTPPLRSPFTSTPSGKIVSNYLCHRSYYNNNKNIDNNNITSPHLLPFPASDNNYYHSTSNKRHNGPSFRSNPHILVHLQIRFGYLTITTPTTTVTPLCNNDYVRETQNNWRLRRHKKIELE